MKKMVNLLGKITRSLICIGDDLIEVLAERRNQKMKKVSHADFCDPSNFYPASRGFRE